MYSIYVLKSEKDGHMYIGLSVDPIARLKSHNLGKTRSTKSRRPFKLVYTEEVGTLKDARAKEKWLKCGQGRDWIRRYVFMAPSSIG